MIKVCFKLRSFFATENFSLVFLGKWKKAKLKRKLSIKSLDIILTIFLFQTV